MPLRPLVDPDPPVVSIPRTAARNLARLAIGEQPRPIADGSQRIPDRISASSVEVVRLLEVLGRVESLEFAVLDHHDPVADLECGETVRNDDDRHLLSERVERLTDQVLAPDVERTRRFVEDEDVRVLDQRSSDDQPLLLSAAEVTALFADLPLVALGEASDVVVQVGET